MQAGGVEERYEQALHLTGRSCTPEESQAAFDAMLAVAREGFLPAMVHVAMKYDDGGWDGEEAIAWLRRAAHAGDPDCAWRLAAYYPEELDPGQDPDEVMAAAARAGGAEALQDAADKAGQSGDDEALGTWLDVALQRGGPTLAVHVLDGAVSRPGALSLFERALAAAQDDEDARRRIHDVLARFFHRSGSTDAVAGWLDRAVPSMPPKDLVSVSALLPLRFARTCLERLRENHDRPSPTSSRTWHEIASDLLREREERGEDTGTAGW